MTKRVCASSSHCFSDDDGILRGLGHCRHNLDAQRTECRLCIHGSHVACSTYAFFAKDDWVGVMSGEELRLSRSAKREEEAEEELSFDLELSADTEFSEEEQFVAKFVMAEQICSGFVTLPVRHLQNSNAVKSVAAQTDLCLRTTSHYRLLHLQRERPRGETDHPCLLHSPQLQTRELVRAAAVCLRRDLRRHRAAD